jgi:hypothetical protein
MSEATLQKMLALFDSIDEHSELVREKMEKAGLASDPGLVESVAKYWPALEKLSAE